MKIDVIILVILAVVGVGLTLVASAYHYLLGAAVLFLCGTIYAYYPSVIFRNRLVYKIEKVDERFKVSYQYKSLTWQYLSYYMKEEEAHEAIIAHEKSLHPPKNIEIGQYIVDNGNLIRMKDMAP